MLTYWQAVMVCSDVSCAVLFSGIHKESRPVLVEDVAVQLQCADNDCVVARRTNCRISYVVSCQRVQCHVGTVCRHIPRHLLKYANCHSNDIIIYLFLSLCMVVSEKVKDYRRHQ